MIYTRQANITQGVSENIYLRIMPHYKICPKYEQLRALRSANRELRN